MNGYVDQITGNKIIGWCAPSCPGTPAVVSAKMGAVEVAQVRADSNRLDVEKAGICDARCGFEMMIPLRAFDRFGSQFSVLLERVEDGVVLAESIAVSDGGDSWVWSPADIAVIAKKWREELSISERSAIRRRIAGFDTEPLVAALLEYGFFDELEMALAAREDPDLISKTWFSLDSALCTDSQVTRWTFACKLKVAMAYARVARLKSTYLDQDLMPVLRELLENGLIQTIDWMTLLHLYSLCPDASSLGELFHGMVRYLCAGNPDTPQLIDACMSHGRVNSAEMAANRLATRISCEESMPALCCYIVSWAGTSGAAQDCNLDAVIESLEKAAKRSPEREVLLNDVNEQRTSTFDWPVYTGVRWPHYQCSDPRPAILLSFVIFIENDASSEGCHESILSILNQSQKSQLFLIGDTSLISGVTRERIERAKSVKAYYHNGNPESINLLREAADQIDGQYISWLDAGDLVGPGAIGSIRSILDDSQHESLCSAIGMDTADCTGRQVQRLCSASHLAELSAERLSRIEEEWLEHQFLSGGYLFITPRLFITGIGKIRGSVSIHSLQYAICSTLITEGRFIRHVERTGLYRLRSLQPIEPRHTREILQQAEQRALLYDEAGPTKSATSRLHALLSNHFKSETLRITIMSSRLSKIFSPDSPREIREHFASLGYQAELVEEISPAHIVPGQLILILVHQHGAEQELIPTLAARFPDCPLIGWFWDNHQLALGNVELAQHFNACIAAHDFSRNILVSRRNVLLPSVPLCVTQWTATEAELLFDKFGYGQRSDSVYGGFVRYSRAVLRNEFVTVLQDHFERHALSMVDEHNLAAYFELPAKERFSEWCAYRSSLCVPLCKDLSQRFFDSLLCGQIPIATEDIEDLPRVVQAFPELANRFEFLPRYDIDEFDRILHNTNHRSAADPNLSPPEQHKYALSHHMFKHRLEAILSELHSFAGKQPGTVVSNG